MKQIPTMQLEHVELARDCSLALVVRRAFAPQAPGRDAKQETWALLRTLLARFTSCPPASLHFERSAQGKPRVVGGGAPAFSLSHSRAYSLMAFSWSGDIGCDVEDRFTGEDVSGLCPLILHPTEVDEMDKLPAQDRPDAFRRYWVRKEAVLKAAGSGFLSDPRELITGQDGTHARWSAQPGPAFAIHNRQIEAGCIAAVASMDSVCRWRLLGTGPAAPTATGSTSR